MLKFPRSAYLILACAAAIPLAGCAHGGKGKSDTAYVARDVNTLYFTAGPNDEQDGLFGSLTAN